MSSRCGIMDSVNERFQMPQGFSNSIPAYRPPSESASLAASPFVNCSGDGSSLEAPIKTCTKCGEEKPATLEYFYASKAGKNGLRSSCKTCTKKQGQGWHESHKESKNESSREYYATHKESRSEWHRKYRQENPEKMREYDREHNGRRRQDVGCRVSDSISGGMRKSLKDGKNGRHWEDVLGYTLADLISCLESQFTKGMAWSNFGAWHIDHRRPISHFNFESPDDPEFLECFSLWNLQPLWAKDNLSKNNKCEAPPLPLRNGVLNEA